MKYAPYSHSRISTFLQCKNKFNLKYVKKIPVESKLTKELVKGIEWHEYIEKYIKKGDVDASISEIVNSNNILKNIFNDKIEIIGTEIKVELNNFLGFIDCLLLNKETRKYIIIDWKTGKAKSELEATKGLDQIGLYALYVKEVYGCNPIGIYNYVEHNKIVKIEYTDDKLADIKKSFDHIISTIENADDEELATKSQTVLCRYCEFKSICYK